MSKQSTVLAYSLAITVLLGGLAVSAPLFAQSPADATQTPLESSESPTAKAPMPMGRAGMMSPERVEARIKELRDKLKITEAQAAAWDKVAATMRDNANRIHALVQARHDKSGRTAIEDLESYKKIANAHAEGLDRFIPVFQALYDSMSPEQKKNADTVFSNYEGSMRGRKAFKRGPRNGTMAK
jgi:hypothetical protein